MHDHLCIDAERASDKIQHSFLTKTLNKVDVKGTYLNLIKAIYDKPQITSYSIMERGKLFL